MKKEQYVMPQSAVAEMVWSASVCQTSGTEPYGTDDGLIYPDDSWR